MSYCWLVEVLDRLKLLSRSALASKILKTAPPHPENALSLTVTPPHPEDFIPALPRPAPKQKKAALCIPASFAGVVFRRVRSKSQFFSTFYHGILNIPPWKKNFGGGNGLKILLNILIIGCWTNLGWQQKYLQLLTSHALCDIFFVQKERNTQRETRGITEIRIT